MCSLHREMATVLLELSHTGVFRGAEAAYHLHQLFVGYDSMFGRPCADAAIECEQLAHTLWQTAIHLQARPAVSPERGKRDKKKRLCRTMECAPTRCWGCLTRKGTELS
ncbi:unnamed protein product [Ectocarpus sp. 12 AP-2014]